MCLVVTSLPHHPDETEGTEEKLKINGYSVEIQTGPTYSTNTCPQHYGHISVLRLMGTRETSIRHSCNKINNVSSPAPRRSITSVQVTECVLRTLQ